MSMVPLHQPSKTFFPNLDGLRTIACLAVFGFHSFFTILPANSAPARAFSLFGSGNMGVNFFFVLSGFLITYLLLEEEKHYQQINLLAFYRRRILRIWPLFYASLAYGFLLLPWLMRLLAVSYHERGSGWLHVAFLGNFSALWLNKPTASNLQVLWSVAVEEQFYLIWPVLLMLLFRNWRPGAFILVIITSIWLRYTHSTNGWWLYLHSMSVMSDLAVGGAAAWVSFCYPAFRKHIAGWSRSTITILYLVGIILAVMGGHRLLPETAELISIKRIIRSMFFVFIILEQNYATNSWFKIKNVRWLTYWGTFTYGFYCLHPIVLEWLVFCSEYWHLSPTVLNTVVRTVIGLPLSAGIAWLSYTYFEKPFLRLKDRLQVIKHATQPLSKPAALNAAEVVEL